MRRTYQQRRWPETPLFQNIAKKWCSNQSHLLMDLVWRAVDLVCQNDLSKLPMEASDEAKEESLNSMLSVRIEQLKSGDEPFAVVHQPPEPTQRKTKNARSPTPDIGFVWYENQMCVWPMEGKILAGKNGANEYATEVETNFLTGRYASYSTEGAMLGYLLTGSPAKTLESLAKKLSKRFSDHPNLSERTHKISKHKRKKSETQPAGDFYCHHLVFSVGGQS